MPSQPNPLAGASALMWICAAWSKTADPDVTAVAAAMSVLTEMIAAVILAVRFIICVSERLVELVLRLQSCMALRRT
jgi:hypothetical protein